MAQGWIKVNREITAHWIFTDPEKFKIWMYLLLNATHKKHVQNVGYELVNLDPGELIFGTIKVAKRLGITSDKLYRTIKLLEKDGMITYDTETYKGQFSIIKINKWMQYQKPTYPTEQEERISSQEPNKSLDEAQQEPQQTNNKGYKGKNEKNSIVPSSEIDKIYNSLTNYWKQLFQSYIEIYRSKNTTGKITDNRHYKLLNEVNQILQEKKFNFNGTEYQITEDILEDGINTIVEKGIANINYAKQIFISDIEKKKTSESNFVKSNIKDDEFQEWYSEQI